MDVHTIREYIDHTKVVSFDVFDTLLFRLTAKPEDIFCIMGKQLGIPDFEKLRVNEQKEISRILLKKKEAPHANLEQIYAYLEKKDSSHDWKAVKDMELQMEKDVVFCNKEMYEVYQYALAKGKRVIAVSDMYFDGQQIQMLLEQCGYKDFAAVYSSADLKKTKYEKTIYPEVARLEKINAKDIFHIGDNQNADVKNARECGWTAYWYEKKNGNKELDKGLFGGLSRKVRQNPSFYYSLGGEVAGNLYVELYDWVFKLEKKYHCSKVFLLARDGYNFLRICEKMGKKEEVEYLETSRRALLLAGITKLDDESLKLLPPYALGQTLEEILDYLRMKEVCVNYKDAGFRSLQDVIRTDEDRERVKCVFKLNEKKVLEVCEKEREQALLYFKGKKVFDEKPLFFDCGWNGSSQYLLKRFFDAVDYNDELRFAYVGIMNTSKSKEQLRGLKFDTFLFGPEKNQDIEKKLARAIVIPELFFGAPHPSVWYYSDGEAIYEGENVQEYKEQISEGISDYVHRIYYFRQKYHIKFKSDELIKAMERLIKNPTKEEAIQIGNIENVDGFVKQETQKKYIARLDRKTIQRYPRIEIYWQEGLLKRPDITMDVKCYVLLKNTVKKLYKIVRRK